MKGYRFSTPGELKVYGYSRDLTEYVTKKQLIDEELWKLFVNQFRIHSDKNGEWKGEFWGKTMRGACLTYVSDKDERLYKVLVNTIEDMLSVQEKSGRISTYAADFEFNGWDMWCRKYVMLGMLYFLSICKSKSLKARVIGSLKKQADYIMKYIGDGKKKKSIFDTSKLYGAMNSCSILEAFVKLYGITKEQRYLDFSTYIVNGGFSKNLNLVEECLNKRKYPYQFGDVKAYEMMSCFEGLTEYYKFVKDDRYLQAAENFVEMLAKTDYTIIGCCGCSTEMLDNSSVTQTKYSDDIMQETCVTVTFIKLCAKVYLLTGKPQYMDYIERSTYNALYGSVNDTEQTMKRTDGDVWVEDGCYQVEHEPYPFDSYSPLVYNRRGKKVGGFMVMQDGRSYGCCACIGSAGLAVASLASISVMDDGFSINLYNSFMFKSDYDGATIKIVCNADVYTKNKAKIKVNGGGKEFAIKLRVPEWMEEYELKIDGKIVKSERIAGYVSVKKAWSENVIELTYVAHVKENVLNDKVAFTKGPVVLARDVRFGDIAKPVSTGKSAFVKAKRVKNDKFKNNVTYKISIGNESFWACDYASAGKNYDEENSCITVWQNIKTK